MPKLVVNYKMWGQALHKWDSYIENKNTQKKYCDPWCRHILNSVEQGKTIAYNSGGMFFKDFNKDIIVVENSDCPVNVPDVLNVQDVIDVKVDNLIMINPITLKYNFSIINFLTVPQNTRGGWKPNLLNWLNAHGKIFLSFSDWHLYYDRLKYSAIDMVEQQLVTLKKHNIDCVYKKIDEVNRDGENGNIKLILQAH